MEKRGWIVLLVVFAVLSVVSVINITGFAVDDPFFTEEQYSELDDEKGAFVVFPGSSGEEVYGREIGDGGLGENNPQRSLSDDEIPVEYHSECSQELCVVVEGPGENQCETNSNCAAEAVCGDGICNAGIEDEVTCAEDCSLQGDENQADVEGEETIYVPEKTNPALGQGELSDDDYADYIANSFSTCTNDFGLCVRVPKIIGNERDICGVGLPSCEEIKEALDERAAQDYVQLSSPNEDNFVIKFLSAFLGWGS